MNPVKLILVAVVLAVVESVKHCPPGNYIVKKSGACHPCPMGSFQPRANKYECRPCQGNTISKTEGSTECTACPKAREPHRFRHRCVCKKGSVKEDGKCVQCRPGTIFQMSRNYAFCSACPPGYYQPDAGQFECLQCPEGTASNSGAIECVACEDDERLIKDRCVKCDAGYSTESFGCLECPTNMYKPKAGLGPCLPCPVGFHSDPGSAYCTPCPKGTVPLHNGKCGSCKAGYYFSEYNRKCRKCFFNEFTPKRNVRTSCYFCSDKKFALKGSTKCVRCPKNKFLNKDGICKPCPQGHVFQRYKLKCQCRVNEYTRGGKESCDRCPTGSYSYPGSTSCFKCKKDKALILKKKKCAKCPPGHTYDIYNAKCTLCGKGNAKREPGLGPCVYCGDSMTSNENRTECVPLE